MGARERIIKAAEQRFAEDGYYSASIRSVARQAGVTNPTIYHHFGSKEGLFRAVVANALGLYSTRVAEAMEGSDGALERLVALLCTSIRLCRDRPRLAELVYLARIRSVKLAGVEGLFLDKKRELGAVIGACLDDAVGDRLTPDQRDFAATSLMCLLDGLTQLEVLDEQADPISADRVRWLLERFLDGLARGGAQTRREDGRQA